MTRDNLSLSKLSAKVSFIIVGFWAVAMSIYFFSLKGHMPNIAQFANIAAVALFSTWVIALVIAWIAYFRRAKK